MYERRRDARSRESRRSVRVRAGDSIIRMSLGGTHIFQEEEEDYKLLPANKADHLCCLEQTCSNLFEIQTV